MAYTFTEDQLVLPTVSRFYGIVIRIYFDDHDPPHFHAIYGENRAIFEIATGGILHGQLPPKAVGMVSEWARLHHRELMDDWFRARKRQPLVAIDPLE